MHERVEASKHGSVGMLRVGWWLGVVGPLLILVGFFVVDEGGTELSGSTADIVGHLSALHGRIVVGSMIGVLGAFALIGFAASLRLGLSRGDALGEWLGIVGFGSGLIMAIGAIVFGSFRLAIASIVESGEAPDEMLPLWELDTVAAILVWGCVGVVTTMCIAAFTADFIPKVLAGVGALLVAGTIALAPTDHGGVSLTLLPWLVVASGFLLSRQSQTTRS